jgi:hypothetical protein
MGCILVQRIFIEEILLSPIRNLPFSRKSTRKKGKSKDITLGQLTLLDQAFAAIDSVSHTAIKAAVAVLP